MNYFVDKSGKWLRRWGLALTRLHYSQDPLNRAMMESIPFLIGDSSVTSIWIIYIFQAFHIKHNGNRHFPDESNLLFLIVSRSGCMNSSNNSQPNVRL